MTLKVTLAVRNFSDYHSSRNVVHINWLVGWLKFSNTFNTNWGHIGPLKW